MHMCSTVTANSFILALISFPVKIWHEILHLVTPPLAVMAVWILFDIVKYRTFRSSVCRMYQICKSFLQISVFYIWHSSNLTLYNDPDSFYGAQLWTVKWPIKYISTLIPDKRMNALQRYGMVRYFLDASRQG